MDKLIDPSGVALAWWFVLGGVLAAMALVIIFAFWIWSYQRVRRVKVAPIKASDQERWVARIDAIVARHEAPGEEHVRALHLELAAELRAILGERAKKDLASWQVSQLRRVPEFREVAGVIDSWERPSFSANCQADIHAARERAVQAVLAW